MTKNLELSHIHAGDGQDVYFAAPHLDDASRQRNAELTARIEQELGLSVFLPQRDGLEPIGIRDFDLADDEIARQIIDLDTRKVMGSHILVAVLGDQMVDDNVAYDIGVATAQRQLDLYSWHRQIIGYKPTTHAFQANQDISPRIAESLDYLTHTSDELIECIGQEIMRHGWYQANSPTTSYHDFVSYM